MTEIVRICVAYIMCAVQMSKKAKLAPKIYEVDPSGNMKMPACLAWSVLRMIQAQKLKIWIYIYI